MRLTSLQRVDYLIGGMGLVLLRPLTVVLGRLLRRDHDLEARGDIGVLKLVGGGSLLLAGQALLGLRQRYPGRRLVLMTTAEVVPFAESLGVFDEYAVVETADLWRLLRSGVAALMRGRKLDTIIDLEPYSRLSTVFATLTMARNRIGFYLDSTFWRKGLSTHLVFFSRSARVGRLYDTVVRAVGAEPEDRRSVPTCRPPRPMN